MSDYGYRPGPPPEDGRAQGRAAGQGRGPQGPRNEPDYGWGGPQQPAPGQGPSPRQRPGYGTPPGGQAPVGRGSASVGGTGRARPAGSASVGSASVGGGSGRASVGRASGSASVGSASVGSASVGSASVGSAPAGGRANGDRTERANRPGAGGRRRAGKGPLSKADLEGDGKKKRKRFGRKMLAALIAVGVLFVTGVTVVASYFFVDVGDVENIARAGESTSFLYADGDEAGGYGASLRLQADYEEIPETVTDALVATEDRKFWDHNGVNVTRTIGALVNNLTGGSTQGASTITQQYAGMVMQIRDEISYDRKAREAAMAMKIESEYSKEQIITAYLNLAYFGRGATGIKAAADVYFGKPLEELSYAEASYIVMQVKSPNGYYDPAYPDYYNEQATQERWDYSMDALVETGDLTQAERDEYTLPVPQEEFNSTGSWGGDTDIGFIINEIDGYVFDELEERYGLTREELYGAEDGTGGYTVTLTIDPQVQASLRSTGSRGDLVRATNDDGEYVNGEGEVVESAGDAALAEDDEGYIYYANDNEDAALAEYEPYMTTAMVAVDPETGDVLGYYGGDDGFGVDKAGAESPHPPSSTFKMITAATAMSEGDSIDSWFNASSPRPFDSLVLEEEEACIGSGDYPDCTLRNGGQDSDIELTLTDALRQSKNTPMYAISEHYGADRILQTADDMGLDMMTQTRQLYDDEGNPHDVLIGYELDGEGSYSMYGEAVDAEGNWVEDDQGLIRKDTPIALGDNCTPLVNLEGALIAEPNLEPVPCEIGGNGSTDPFYNHIAFGQYATSVANMASMYATLANDGFYNESHFVASVTDREGNEVAPTRELDSGQVIDSEIARDLQWVGSEIAGESETTDLPRDFFGKTGTWEAAGVDDEGNEYPSGYNAHAWYVGAIPQLAIAAWVGNATSESDPIAGPGGDKYGVFGSNTAYPVWFDAMTRILEAKDGDEHWDPQDWEGATHTGNVTDWDIEEAGGPVDGGAFCGDNPDDGLCAGQQDEEAKEACEADGGTWDDQTKMCTPADDDGDPGDGTTPTGEETTTDDECDSWFPPDSCSETDPNQEECEANGGVWDPATGTCTPAEGETTDPEGNGNGNGG